MLIRSKCDNHLLFFMFFFGLYVLFWFIKMGTEFRLVRDNQLKRYHSVESRLAWVCGSRWFQNTSHVRATMPRCLIRVHCQIQTYRVTTKQRPSRSYSDKNHEITRRIKSAPFFPFYFRFVQIKMFPVFFRPDFIRTKSSSHMKSVWQIVY